MQNQLDIFKRPQQLKLPTDTVRKSNDLARARLGVKDVLSYRILACIAACVDYKDKDLQTYTVPITKLNHKQLHPANGKGYKSGYTYQLVSDAVKHIRSNGWIEIETDGILAEIWLLTKIIYHKQKGYITASINPQLKDHFINLHKQKQYVRYGLDAYLMLSTAYSQLLFELLCSIKSMEDFSLPLDYLYHRLQVPDGTPYADFRRYVLNPAQKEIMDYTDLRFAWFPDKQRGQSVVAIRFVFNSKIIKTIENEQKRAESRRKTQIMQEAYRCRKKQGLQSGEMCVKPFSKCTKEQQKMCKEFFCPEK